MVGSGGDERAEERPALKREKKFGDVVRGAVRRCYRRVCGGEKAASMRDDLRRRGESGGRSASRPFDFRQSLVHSTSIVRPTGALGFRKPFSPFRTPYRSPQGDQRARTIIYMSPPPPSASLCFPLFFFPLPPPLLLLTPRSPFPLAPWDSSEASSLSTNLPCASTVSRNASI